MAQRIDIHDLRAKLTFDADEQSAAAMEKALDRVEQELKDVQESADETTKRLNGMREQAERMQEIGTTLAVAGTAIMTPMMLAAKAYLDEVGEGERASAKWAASQEKLHEASVKIGRETVEILGPLLEKGAELASDFADVLEKNPWITKAILAGGATLVTAGGVMTLAAQTQRTVSTVQLLVNSINGANFAALGSKIGAMNPMLGGLGIAITGLVALLNSEFGQQGLKAGGQMLSFAAGGAGRLIGGEELGNDWFLSVARLTGAIEKADSATQLAIATAEGASATQMKLYLDFQKAEREAESAHAEQRSTVISQARSAQAQADEDFERSRIQKVRNFYQQDKQDLSDYYAERLRKIRDANDEAAEVEEDHQREMARLAENHDERMESLVAARDALGMVREMRSAEKERRQAESDYQAEVAQRNQQLAKELADGETDFQAQREQRMAQFEQTLKDEADQHEIQRKRNQQALQDQLRDLDTQYRQEKARRRQAFTEQLQDTADALTQERLLKQKFNEAMLADLRNLIAQAESGNPAYPSRDIGGYTGNGLYNMHAGEFVMTNRTTAAAEKAIGGRLNQESIMQLLAGRPAGNRLNYTDNRRINSKINSEDRAMINRDLENAIGGIFG